MCGELSTLQPRFQFNHLRSTIIPLASSTGRVNGDHIMLAWQWRQPYLHFAVSTDLQWQWRRAQPHLHCIEFENRFAACSETDLFVLRELLPGEAAKVRSYLPPISNLLQSQPMRFH